MPTRKERGERYIDRWMREHPRVTFYLAREEYEKLKELAASKGLTVKELILEAVDGLIDLQRRYYRGYRAGEEAGLRKAYKQFIEEPHAFYKRIKEMAPDLEPMLFTHRDPDVEDVKEWLKRGFYDVSHKKCVDRYL
jgi:hypothetical protein